MKMCHRSYPGQGQRLNLEEGHSPSRNEAAAFPQVPLFWRPRSPQLLSKGEVAGDPSLGLGEGCLAVVFPCPPPGIIK